MSALASTIDETLNGDTTADGRVVNKSELEQQFQAAKDDFNDLSAAVVRFARVTATIAEINAGHTLVDGVSGKSITVLDFKVFATGTFSDLTSVEIEDSNATPKTVASIAAAGLGDGETVDYDDGDVTLTLANFGTALTAGADLVATKTGTDEATATSATFLITYTIG